MGRLLAFWWIPAAAALAATIGWETNWGEALTSHPVIPPAPEARPLSSALLPEYKPTAGPEAYAEVIDRPLFSPTRRQAPPPPPPEPVKPTMITGQYSLTGTIQVGDKFFAFMREVKGGKGFRAAQGDVLASGIKVAKVEPDRVVLTQYDSDEEVKLQVSKSTRTTPAAQPAPGAPGAPVTQAVAPPGPAPVPGQITAPVVPGSPTLAPFVPGVSVVPPSRPNSNPEPNAVPRRRGAVQ